MELKLTEVKSSHIQKVGYDEKEKELVVVFNSGTYIYLNVERQTYEDLMKAESKGKFLNENISKKYDYYKSLVEF